MQQERERARGTAEEAKLASAHRILRPREEAVSLASRLGRSRNGLACKCSVARLLPPHERGGLACLRTSRLHARDLAFELGEGPVVCAEHRLHAREIMLRLHATEIMLQLFDPLLVVRLRGARPDASDQKEKDRAAQRPGLEKRRGEGEEARGERREERVEVGRRGGTHRGQRNPRR